MLGPNASAIEVLWTALGLLALAVNLVLLSRAVGNLRALDALGQNGGRRLSAWTAIGIQIGLTLPQAVTVAIGVAVLRLPPTKAPTLAGAIVGGGLVANEAILAAVAVYALARWHILDRYFDARAGAAASEAEAVAETRHTETMVELTHNTEITTEARDGAIEAFHAANELNSKIAETNRVAGEAAAAAMESTDKLRVVLERQERERTAREGGE
mgnify:CR=1 FL=1